MPEVRQQLKTPEPSPALVPLMFRVGQIYMKEPGRPVLEDTIAVRQQRARIWMNKSTNLPISHCINI